MNKPDHTTHARSLLGNLSSFGWYLSLSNCVPNSKTYSKVRNGSHNLKRRSPSRDLDHFRRGQFIIHWLVLATTILSWAKKSPFPVDFRYHSYNSSSINVLHCEVKKRPISQCWKKMEKLITFQYRIQILMSQKCNRNPTFIHNFWVILFNV